MNIRRIRMKVKTGFIQMLVFIFFVLIFHLNFQGLQLLQCNGILLLQFYMQITRTVVQQMQQPLTTK